MTTAPAAVDHVNQLVARSQRGEGVPDLGEFLLRTCRPSAQGWLVSLLFGSSSETVDVYDVQRHRDEPFQQSCLFWVWATGVALDHTLLPGRIRSGLFAYGPGGYRYVSRRRSELEAMLDADARPLDDYDPVSLGRVLIDALANQGPYTHALLDAPSRLRSATPVDGFTGTGYRVDEAELRRCEPLLTAPHISGNEQGGWTLELHTLYGWMHDKRLLCRLRYHIRCTPGGYRQRPSSFRVDERIDTLSERIFREVPLVRY